jgi:hypothetical protein
LTQLCNNPIFMVFEFLVEIPCLVFYVRVQWKLPSLVFVVVLMGWSLLPNALRSFKINCAPRI